MCCFSYEVDVVADTCIFGRLVGSRQVLVYQMRYASERELAMVLPIPVPARTPQDAVRFVNLEHCKDFFEDLNGAFPNRSRFEGAVLGAAHLGLADLDAVETLAVHDVGAFEASFVPTPMDFGRLDERFRLPPELWLSLGTYRDYGFAVFKLHPGKRQRAHPMAFEFPTRDPQRLFFPTLHIHDRTVKPIADFDHTLYCQATHEMQWHMQGWEDTDLPAGAFMKCEQARPLFDLELPCWRLKLDGRHDNRDTWVGKGGAVPKALMQIV